MNLFFQDNTPFNPSRSIGRTGKMGTCIFFRLLPERSLGRGQNFSKHHSYDHVSENTQKVTLSCLAFFLMLLGMMNTTAAAQTPFEQLTRKFEHGRVFKAQFKHHYKDAYTGDEATRSGDIWIARKEYKIETKNQRVAVDGELSHVYDRKKNRVIISKYVPEDDDFAPSRILNGIDSTYTIKTQKETSQGYFIELDSDDPFASFQRVQITLDRRGIPTKIFVRDPADNLITTRFSGGKFTDRHAGMFELSYPDSVKLIDMRQ